jgi:hypothetical protein
MATSLRIGCGGGFWGDTGEGPGVLVRSGEIDVLVVDYLAEITMALLGRARARTPSAGYVPEFVEQMAALGPEIAQRGIRVVVNAGGVNPQACGEAVRAALAAKSVSLSVAVIDGDDLMDGLDALRAAGTTDMFTGAPFPATAWSANAYLGARPIAAALAAGAQIVVTGRVADSALVLGPLMQHFGWAADDWDRLAMGSLAGHIVECGCQATGGIVTDWRDVPGWEDMGFPIVACEADGSFIVSKNCGSGGLVSPATVGEQIVYEVGDPAAYVLPDVVCDFSQVRLEQVGPDRVRVTGARGRPATDSYKASITYPDGFKAAGLLMIGGREAAEKARRTAQALEARCARLLAARGLPPFRRVGVEALGSEATYGPHASAGARATREVILKMAVEHASRDGAEVFSREFLSSATAMAQGITGFAGGRPKVSPVIRLFSCLVDKALAPARVQVDGRVVPVPEAPVGVSVEMAPAATTRPAAAEPFARSREAMVTVPLIALATGRSGDKGDSANIGVLARRPEFAPLLAEVLTEEAVAGWFAHVLAGPVQRYAWPGLNGFNFVLNQALDGGGVASLRHDPQGKAFAQMLMDFPVAVPRRWLDEGLVEPTFAAAV